MSRLILYEGTRLYKAAIKAPPKKNPGRFRASTVMSRPDAWEPFRIRLKVFAATKFSGIMFYLPQYQVDSMAWTLKAERSVAAAAMVEQELTGTPSEMPIITPSPETTRMLTTSGNLDKTRKKQSRSGLITSSKRWRRGRRRQGSLWPICRNGLRFFGSP